MEMMKYKLKIIIIYLFIRIFIFIIMTLFIFSLPCITNKQTKVFIFNYNLYNSKYIYLFLNNLLHNLPYTYIVLMIINYSDLVNHFAN